MEKYRKYLVALIIVLLCPGIVGACASLPEDSAPELIWPGEEWPTSSPEDQGMDSGMLDQMMERIEERDAAIDSVLVIRNGYLVFEQYRRNWKATSRHHIQSATKSFTSTLVGIAIAEGFIRDVDQRLLDFYPDRVVSNPDPRKEDITIKDLLTMSEGMDWHEVDLPYDHPENSLGQMWGKADVIQHVLDQPMARKPGEAWNYNSGTSMLLGNIVERASGMDILSFAREYLFGPLGIVDVTWEKADSTHYHTDGGLYMLPRDMARLGYLMLREGIWEGKQILPADWVREASTAFFTTPGGRGYGYQWWVSPQSGIFSARGHYDQAIYVIPEADLVVVFTANIPDEAIHPEDGLLARYILGACQDLPEAFTSRQYENYGFSLDHGMEFTPLEIPGLWSETLSESSGMVQFHSIAYPAELMLVSWDESTFGLDPEMILQESVLAMANLYGLAIDEEEISYLPFHDASIPAWGVSLEVEGFAFSGISGVWTCGNSDRRYHLTYLSDAEAAAASREDQFQDIFGSFECQE